MEPVPGESQAKKQTIEKGIAELLQLKEQVALKRRQLKALGLNDEPELKSKLIKYPDMQAKYKQAKAAKAAPEPEPVPVPAPSSVPANSPFIDPHAPKSKPIPIPAPVKEPVKEAPVPVKEQAPTPTPTPVPVQVQAPVPAPARPVRISHNGKWF